MPSDISAPIPANKTLAPLSGAERILIALILLIGVAAAAVSFLKAQPVAWGAFANSFLPAKGLVLVGLYLRGAKNAPKLAKIAIGNGIFIGFAGVITILIYLRFPVGIPLMDPALERLDIWLGFTWPEAVHLLEPLPELGQVMRWVYLSSLPQLVALIVFLGASGRHKQLDRSLIAGCLSLLFCVALWWAWPSIGPSAFYQIDPDFAADIGLFHDASMGARLTDLVSNGTALIHPATIMGTIAFPSYHMVMLCTVLTYAHGTKAFLPTMALNALMLPAILTHGGHYTADMIGGVVVFVLAALIAKRLVPAP